MECKQGPSPRFSAFGTCWALAMPAIVIQSRDGILSAEASHILGWQSPAADEWLASVGKSLKVKFSVAEVAELADAPA